jgi:polyketide cyclase/dehydrase/lipid transport protein
MAITHEQDVAIARPPADAFAKLVDVEHWPTWLIASGIVRVERLMPGELGAGSSLRIEQRVAGRAATLDARVTALEAPARFGVTGKASDGISIDIDATVEPTATGCVLRWKLRIGLPLKYRAFESLAAPQVRRAAALDLEAFRIRLESAAKG